MALLRWVVAAAVASVALARHHIVPVRTRSNKAFIPSKTITLDYAEVIHDPDQHHYFADVRYTMRHPAVIVKEHQENIMDASCPSLSQLSIDFSSESAYNIAKNWTLPMYAVVIGGDGGCGVDDNLYHPFQIYEVVSEDPKQFTLTFDSFQSHWQLAASHHQIVMDHTSHVPHRHARHNQLTERDFFNTKPVEWKSSLAFNYDTKTQRSARTLEIWKKSGIKDLADKQNKSSGTFEYKVDISCINCYTNGDVTLFVDTGSPLGNALVHSTEEIIKVGAKIVDFVVNAGKTLWDKANGVYEWNLLTKHVAAAHVAMDKLLPELAKQDPITSTTLDIFIKALRAQDREFQTAYSAAKPHEVLLETHSNFKKRFAAWEEAQYEWNRYSNGLGKLYNEAVDVYEASDLYKQYKRADEAQGIDTQAKVEIRGKLKTNVDLLLSFEGEYTTKRFERNITSRVPIPYLGFVIPQVLSVGATDQLLAVAEAKFAANISFQAGFDLEWKDFKATAVLGDMAKSGTSLKPDSANFHKPSNFTLGKVSIGAMFGVQNNLAFGVDLEKANKKVEALIALTAGLAPSLAYGDDDCDAGIQLGLNAEVGLSAEAVIGSGSKPKRPKACAKGPLATLTFDPFKLEKKDKRDFIAVGSQRMVKRNGVSILSKFDKTIICDLFSMKVLLSKTCIDFSNILCKDTQRWSDKSNSGLGGCVDKISGSSNSTLSVSATSSSPPASSSS